MATKLRDPLRARLKRRMRTLLYPHQRKGVRFLERVGGRGLVLDDMGLGKTIQAIAYLALHRKLRPVVVVCNATLKFNWQREFMQHAGLKSYVCDGKITTPEQDREALRKAIAKVKDHRRKLGRNRDGSKRPYNHMERRAKIRQLKEANKRKRARNKAKLREIRKHEILIVNFDVIDAWQETLVQLAPEVLIIDECQKIKNRKARRTKACNNVAKAAGRVIGLSGTPIAGKPVEFYPILNMVRPEEFPSFWKYAFEYCAPKKNRFSGGWDFSGAAHLDALRRRIKPFVIRRLKRKVLKDLPRKTRTVTAVEIENRRIYDRAEEDFLSWLLKRKGEEAWKRASRAEAIVRLNGLKLLAAKGKLKHAIQWIRDWLEDTDQKLIVFGIHKAILKALKREFPDAVVVDGSISAKPVWRKGKDGKRYETSKRQEAVDAFQQDPKKRLLFGQLRAAGEGLNLVAASNVLFLEIGWTPGEHEQAEDRVLRIGQKAKKVSIYYLVGRQTVEERILTIIQSKDETVARILDGKKGGVMKLLKMFMEAA